MDATTMEQQVQNAVSGADASGTDNAASASQPQTDTAGSDGQQVAATGEDVVPRTVMETQLENERRHWQSVIDKRFAAIEQKYAQPVTQPVPPQAQAPTAPPAETFDNDKFMSMLDEDPAAARQYFFSRNQPAQNPADIETVVSSAVQNAIVQQKEHEQQMAQYVDSMNAATEGLTEQEKDRANQFAVQNYQQSGAFTDPYMAAMVGRYGSVQEALRMANAQMNAMGQGASTVPGQPTPPAQPPVTSGPGLVGGGLGQTPQPAGESPGDGAIRPGSFRTLLRR